MPPCNPSAANICILSWWPRKTTAPEGWESTNVVMKKRRKEGGEDRERGKERGREEGRDGRKERGEREKRERKEGERGGEHKA